MKRTRLAIALLAVFILPALLATLPQSAKAALAGTPSDVRVEHLVQVRDGGLMIINDTVKLATKPGETVELTNYTFGFPYGYQSNLDYAFAYEALDPSTKLTLELDAGMGRIGFYGVSVVFPQTVTISENVPYEFTVVFVFSNTVTLIQEGTTTLYNITFPSYPSLTQTASEANLTIVFPTGFNYTKSSFSSQGVTFTRTIIGSEQHFNYVKSNLTEFSEQKGWFLLAKAGGTLKLLEVRSVQRNVEFQGLEQIAVSESYRMVNRAQVLSDISLKLPKGAFSVLAYDELGAVSADKLKTESGNTSTNVSITFARPYDNGKEVLFMIAYSLPWKDYVSTTGWNDFQVSLKLFENFDWTIRKLTVTLTLPEGATATLTSSALSAELSIVQGSAFTSSLTFVFQNATPYQNFPFNFKYVRAIFWESFRPTMWMSAAVIAIAAIIGAWRSAKPTVAPVPTAITGIRAEDLRSFGDLYDEKRRLQREIETLEQQARKGKIPRRNYKVRKMTAESRLTSLTRDLKALEEKIRTAGPRYNDLMRQMEVAETELQGVEADISRTEVRYRRGEISPQAYNKLLEDAYRRRDRAKTTIDGVLLRLREETI